MLTPEAPARYLTEDEVARFWRDGVIIVRGFYAPRWIETVRLALNEICQIDDGASSPGQNPRFRSDAYTWHSNDRVRDFSLFSPTAHLMRQVLRSERINLFCDQIFVKHAGNTERTPWHHDYTFFPLAGAQIASAWTSVDATSTEESALEFAVGSHRWPQRFRPLGVGGIVKSVADLAATPDFDRARDRYEIVSWDMQPGDVVVFHALTVHGSRGRAAGERPRRALATRWCGDDVRYSPTGQELEVAWSHGLRPGDPLGGPVFPQVLPTLKSEDIRARMAGLLAPDAAVLERNRSLAERFEKVAL